MVENELITNKINQLDLILNLTIIKKILFLSIDPEHLSKFKFNQVKIEEKLEIKIIV